MLWRGNTCHNFRIADIPTAVEMRLFRLRFERAVTSAVDTLVAVFTKFKMEYPKKARRCLFVGVRQMI